MSNVTTRFVKTMFFFLVASVIAACGGGDGEQLPLTKSTNANLIGLSVSVGTLAPGFNSDTTVYSIDAGTASTISFTATLDDSNASFTIDGNSATSGAPSAAISLNIGANPIDIVVTAEDGSTTKTYTVTVNRSAAPNSNADLSDLITSAGVLSPPFNSNTLNYTINVANPIDSTTITATVADASATFTINGVSESTGIESAPISLSVGPNAIDVVVTAANGSTSNTYTVTFVRAGLVGSDADLTALDITETTLDQAFNASVTSYTSAVKFLSTSIQLTPTSSDPSAIITINNQVVAGGSLSQSIAVSEGANTIDVVVTSADGLATKTYTVVVTRDTAAQFAQQVYIKSNFLSSLRFSAGFTASSGPTRSVAIDGDTLVVGSPFDEILLNPDVINGGVYVFRRTGGVWAQEQHITGTGNFGTSVDIEGDTLVIGSPTEINANFFSVGKAHIYTRSANTWTLQQTLEASDAQPSSHFGGAVALEGDTVAVSAPGKNLSRGGIVLGFAGSVYIYTRSATSWTERTIITADNFDAADMFGSDIDLDNNTLVVTATGERSNATGIDGDKTNNSVENSGAVYVFIGSGSSWVQDTYIKSDVSPVIEFGQAISLYGDTLAITSTNEIKVYVYVRENGIWAKQQVVQPIIIPHFSEGFGVSIDLYKDTMVVGAETEASGIPGINGDQTDITGPATGAVFMFARNGSIWSEQAFIKASELTSSSILGEFFGRAVAISKDTLAVGSWRNQSGATGVYGDPTLAGSNEGAVYVFD